MTPEQKAALDYFNARIAAACELKDADEIAAIMQDPQYHELIFREAYGEARAREKEGSITPRALLANMLADRAVARTLFVAHGVRRKILEDRIAALEARPTVEYRGVYQRNMVYSRGNMVSHHGCVWHCQRDNVSAEPTFGHGGDSPWTLAVKAERNARE